MEIRFALNLRREVNSPLGVVPAPATKCEELARRIHKTDDSRREVATSQADDTADILQPASSGQKKKTGQVGHRNQGLEVHRRVWLLSSIVLKMFEVDPNAQSGRSGFVGRLQMIPLVLDLG